MEGDRRASWWTRIRWGNVARAAALLAIAAGIVAWPRLSAEPPALPPAQPVPVAPAPADRLGRPARGARAPSASADDHGRQPTRGRPDRRAAAERTRAPVPRVRQSPRAPSAPRHPRRRGAEGRTRRQVPARQTPARGGSAQPDAAAAPASPPPPPPPDEFAFG